MNFFILQGTLYFASHSMRVPLYGNTTGKVLQAYLSASDSCYYSCRIARVAISLITDSMANNWKPSNTYRHALQWEIFGPVAMVLKAKNEEAIKIHNKSDFGLGRCFYS
jgi:hypothetical protein